MAERGYDIIFTEVNAMDAVDCRVCGAPMKVRRNVLASAGFAAALARTTGEHDVWTCSHSEEEWHQRARELVHAIEREPSRRVAALRRMDLEELLADAMG